MGAYMSDSWKNMHVLVTGATGYIAGWVIKRLLEQGAVVHATVRNTSNSQRLSYLQELADQSSGSLTFFEADLLRTGSFNDAVKNCEVIFHIASPYIWQVSDPQTELIDPALEGTRNVLSAANQSKTVRRVIVTSSCLAIYGDTVDVMSAPNKILTEQVWNETSSLNHQPYAFSKTLAEKEAWKLANAQDQWQLIVLNPSAVFGPGIRVHEEAQSFKMMKQFGDGTFKSGIGHIDMGMVDVRDVADAHLAAAINHNASGRYIINGGSGGFIKIAEILHSTFSDYPIPTRTAPKPLLWLLGPLFGMSRKFVSRNVGYKWQADNSKSIKDLGISYRSLATTLEEHFIQLIEAGLVTKS